MSNKLYNVHFKIIHYDLKNEKITFIYKDNEYTKSHFSIFHKNIIENIEKNKKTNIVDIFLRWYPSLKEEDKTKSDF